MNRPLHCMLLAGLLAFGAMFAAQAAVPPRFSYQGFLSTPAGAPVSGSLPMEFRLYDELSGGILAWSESQTVAVANGVFSVILGTNNPVNVVFDKPYYLEVKVGDDPPMVPRHALASVPFAAASGLAGCAFGDFISCYPSAPTSMGVGPCKAGTRTCNPTTFTYGACTGHVLPTVEVFDGIDNDCDGNVDNLAGSSTITVVRGGTGFGTVTSSPAGINCGSDCAEIYGNGSSVTLTATPAAGSTFAGWSGGGCSGTGTCLVTVLADSTVTATFSLSTYTLTVPRAGTGSGTVTSSPAGINCGGDCTEAFNFGTTVVLTAAPLAGSSFTGWTGGGCAGTGTCTVTVTAATTVTATFSLNPYTLTVTKAGTGTGAVTSSPAGISCGGDCTEVFNFGTTVVLTAAPLAGSSFTGWTGGGCAGTGTCTVTVTAATTVTATFSSP